MNRVLQIALDGFREKSNALECVTGSMHWSEQTGIESQEDPCLVSNPQLRNKPSSYQRHQSHGLDQVQTALWSIAALRHVVSLWLM